ncbi:MAG TPA: BMP family protein [Acidimicrobiales bacterium]|nr:BMP family protein [Acidimicrobiales bacterium]
MRTKSRFARCIAALLVVPALTTTTIVSTAPAGGASSMPALKVAVVAPSAVNDLAFTQSMVAALQSLQKSYNLQISISDNEFVVSDAANLIRQYAAKGYNLVIAHGSQYGSILQQLAPKFPKVSFAWGTAGSTFNQPNIWAYQADSNEGGYVQGYMAGMLSKSHVIGIIGPIDVGDAQLYCDGFKAGVLAEDPSATVHESFTGSFSDVTLMSSAAKAYVADGADVLTGSSQSVVGAIGVAKSDHVAWFGTQWTQTSLAPTEVVASQVYNWDPVLKQIFAGIRTGKLGGGTFTITLGNTGEKIVFNPKYPLPANVKAEAEKLISEIASGKLSVPR